jgi:hypothetical protein
MKLTSQFMTAIYFPVISSSAQSARSHVNRFRENMMVALYILFCCTSACSATPVPFAFSLPPFWTKSINRSPVSILQFSSPRRVNFQYDVKVESKRQTRVLSHRASDGFDGKIYAANSSQPMVERGDVHSRSDYTDVETGKSGKAIRSWSLLFRI